MFALFGPVADINKGWQPKNCRVVVSSGVFKMVSGQFIKCICLATEPQELEEKMPMEPEELPCFGSCLFFCFALVGLGAQIGGVGGDAAPAFQLDDAILVDPSTGLPYATGAGTSTSPSCSLMNGSPLNSVWRGDELADADPDIEASWDRFRGVRVGEAARPGPETFAMFDDPDADVIFSDPDEDEMHGFDDPEGPDDLWDTGAQVVDDSIVQHSATLQVPLQGVPAQGAPIACPLKLDASVGFLAHGKINQPKAQFAGHAWGWVFKLGKLGLGYYLDQPEVVVKAFLRDVPHAGVSGNGADLVWPDYVAKSDCSGISQDAFGSRTETRPVILPLWDLLVDASLDASIG